MKSFSILINSDCYYYTTVELVDDKYILSDIGVQKINFCTKNQTNDAQINFINNMSIIDYIHINSIDRVVITFSDYMTEYALIPKSEQEQDYEILKNLIKLYIKELKNSEELDDYDIYISNHLSKNKEMYLINLIDANISSDLIRKIPLGNNPIYKYGNYFFNAIKLFEFNYPNLINKKNALIAFNDGFLTCAVIDNGIINDLENIECNELSNENIDILKNLFLNNDRIIDNVFIFGDRLDKEIFLKVKDIVSPEIPFARLGAFDKFISALDEEKYKYAVSNFHKFSANIGAVVGQSFNNIIKTL